ncbi:MAG: hypothetical protein M3O30_16440 [Planctomycetota bacterium]|nr:hypothetical protein [Planctomycetota bacterium]
MKIISFGVLSICLLVLGACASRPELRYSSREMDHTPSNPSIDFHGPFSNETLTVECRNLGSHDFLDISFDLLILRSWDGSADVEFGGQLLPRIGPDYFRLGVAGGPTLLYTTFSNVPYGGFKEESKFQNYPSPVPGARLSPFSGSAAHNTLGYNYSETDAPDLFPMDATYKIHFIVPHSACTAMLQLQAINLQNITDENWGVRNLRVKAFHPTAAQPTTQPADTATAFAKALDINGDDPVAAFQSLILGMDDTVSWIEKNVKAKPIDVGEARKRIARLHADDVFRKEREEAGTALFKMGPEVEPYLRDDRRTAAAEQRLRIDWILAALGVKPIGDEEVRRVMLATRVLEIIDTPRALKARAMLTGG